MTVNALDDIRHFLGSETPAAWIEAAVANVPLLLLDHKNCEYKAASNAISLMAKYQERLELINALSRLAREELVHYEQVLKILKARHVTVVPLGASRYAAGLRKLVRRSEPGMMTDILLISAFIEARSCERFGAVAPHLDAELAKFYAAGQRGAAFSELSQAGPSLRRRRRHSQAARDHSSRRAGPDQRAGH